MTVRVDEDTLAEQAALELLQALKWSHRPGHDFAPGAGERDSFREVVLGGRLRDAIKCLNPWIDEANLGRVVHRVTQVEATSLIEANEKIHGMLTKTFSVEQEIEGKRAHHTVRLIDFEKPDHNEFLAVNQFVVKGHEEEKRPDLVLFVNGLPLAVIECKAPGLTAPKDQGTKQILTYIKEVERLFWLNHFAVVAASSAGAWYSAIPGGEFFDWKEPWPHTREEIGSWVGRTATPQDVLLTCLFKKDRFLDHIQNFVVFAHEKTGTVKKVARYQQWNAVNKAVDRIGKGKSPRDRSGVVWHTQGSGKSLTMLWLALKLRRDPLHENPTLVIVTDRTDLDDQIHKTFVQCGFKIHRALSVRDLREQLALPSGLTITTTIQKFQEDRKAEGEDRIPLLSDTTNLFVLVDEAHRTNYRSLAANMRTALPNATFLGFTGTPIDKKDRQTHHTFGPYIDTYSIQQAVVDEATVPIYYEGRLPEVSVEGGDSLDVLFDRFFANKSDAEKAEIKKRYAREESIAAAPDRINKIALDIVQHYEKFIAPNGFKAQIVAPNREAAVLYKDRLDALQAPASAVVMSVDHNDTDPRFKACKRTKQEQADLIEAYKKEANPKFLIVCDMLLTGFDAPVEQVMYLDQGLKEHNLLQAIARVNRRCGPEKKYGLIVDYWGVSSFLEQALAIFEAKDVQGALTARKDELPTLQALHAKAMAFFAGINHKRGQFSSEAEARDVYERCVQVLEPEDRRAEFLLTFRRLSQSFDLMLPDPAANPYRGDLKFLGMIVNSARERFRDEQLNLQGCGEKVRQLIAEHIRASGIKILVEPISILDPGFEEHVQKLNSPRAKASEMEHAVRHEIRIKIDEDPAFYGSLRDKLEKIIEEKKAERLSDKDLFERLRVLREELRDREKLAQSHGMSDEEFAFYGLLAPPLDGGEPSKKHRTLAKEIVEALGDLAVLDWEGKPSVQKDMRRQVKRLLRVGEYEDDEIESLTRKIIDLAKTKLRTKT